jgi:Ion channel
MVLLGELRQQEVETTSLNITTYRGRGVNVGGKPRSSSYGACSLASVVIPEALDEEQSSSGNGSSRVKSWISDCDLSDSDDGEEEALPPPPPPLWKPQLRKVGLVSSTRSRRLTISNIECRRGSYAKSPDFRNSWRRKSCRRISALLFQQRRKTAKEHWAILRDHVTSGRFFLDHSHGTKTNQTGDNKRQSSFARSLRNEIRSQYGFTCQQCMMAIAAYLLMAVVFFNLILPETRHNWTIIDTMYFAVVTFTTIGFGARLATCVFALAGSPVWDWHWGYWDNEWSIWNPKP